MSNHLLPRFSPWIIFPSFTFDPICPTALHPRKGNTADSYFLFTPLIFFPSIYIGGVFQAYPRCESVSVRARGKRYDTPKKTGRGGFGIWKCVLSYFYSLFSPTYPSTSPFLHVNFFHLSLLLFLPPYPIPSVSVLLYASSKPY